MGNAVILADRAEGIRCFDPDHRSYSTAKWWDECEWSWHAKAELGIKDFMGPEACVGSAVDEAIGEATMGRDFDLGRLLDEAIADMADPSKAQYWERPKLMAKAQALVDLWDRDVRPHRPPVHSVQLELHFEIPDTDLTAHVHLDTVYEDGWIDDTKTSEKRLKAHRVDNDPQLTWYALGLREVYGQRPGKVSLTGLIYANPPAEVQQAYEVAGLPKPTKPWLDYQIGARTDDQLDALVAEIQRREENRRWAVKTGIYQTNGRTDFFACDRCPAKPICPSWAGYKHEELIQVKTTEGVA